MLIKRTILLFFIFCLYVTILFHSKKIHAEEGKRQGTINQCISLGFYDSDNILCHQYLKKSFIRSHFKELKTVVATKGELGSPQVECSFMTSWVPKDIKEKSLQKCHRELIPKYKRRIGKLRMGRRWNAVSFDKDKNDLILRMNKDLQDIRKQEGISLRKSHKSFMDKLSDPYVDKEKREWIQKEEKEWMNKIVKEYSQAKNNVRFRYRSQLKNIKIQSQFIDNNDRQRLKQLSRWLEDLSESLK